MAVPIWKDKYFRVQKDVVEFRVRLDSASGAIIYQGTAHARPDEGEVRVKVNDICADYIRHSLPVWGEEFTPSEFSRKFVLQYYASSSWQSWGSVEFLWDWSYDYHYLASRDGFSFPVNPLIEGRQFLLMSVDTSAATISAVITFKDGTTETETISIHRTADFNDDYNDDFAIFDMAATTGTAVLDMSEYPDAVSVTINGRTYPVDSSMCHNYVLYYVNAYGGWDSLLLMGRVSEKDNYSRVNQKVVYDNYYPEGRGTKNIVNEVEKTFTMQTGWVDELGASRMHHLLGSTMVYLHDLNTGDVLPVVLTNADCPYKTYGGEGNRLINYTIEATIAQDIVRR